ncbi:MAG: ROK family transcriptional regulator [Spirochaetia bacterium]|nr:ROK family transcriptional regulator [Spirochaetia bacterium]
MRKLVGNSQYQKLANALLVLRRLHKGDTTRVSLARELGLQPSTVTYNVNRLIEAGLVRESLQGPEAGKSTSLGRRAIMLELNSDIFRVIGLELLADCGWASVLDAKGAVLYSQKVEYPVLEGLESRTRFEYLIKDVVSRITSFCNGLPILGVGIALPGIVESNSQAVRDCWTHALKGQDFSSFFQKNFSFPIIMENDANCCVQRYLFEGAEERRDNFLYLLARRYPRAHVPSGVSPFGIGIGLVFGGTLYRGSDSRAGEFISAMMKPSEQGRQLATTLERVEELEENPRIRCALLGELAANIRCIASILDPQTIYLGGFLSDYFDEVQTLLSSDVCDKVVYANAHTDASEGAAVNVLSLFYRIPQVGDTSSGAWRWSALLQSAIE